MPSVRLAVLCAAAIVLTTAAGPPAASLLARVPGTGQAARGDARTPPSPVTAARDPAWSPSGAQIALSVLDQIWVMTRDGGAPHVLVEWPDRRPAIERDPAWSPDGQQIAFAADTGDGFDLFTVPASGGVPRRLTYLPGDERWPGWTPDARVVFAARAEGQWDLYRVPSAPPSGTVATPERLSETSTDETEPRVSPDGRFVAFVAPRDAADGDPDLWILELGARTTASDGRLTTSRGPRRGVLRARGAESSPSWAPDGTRLAFSAMREGLGSIWVVPVDPSRRDDEDTVHSPLTGGPVLVSRHGGQVAWSPDARTLLVTDAPDQDGTYNGQPRRDRGDAVPLFASSRAYAARFLPAPLPPDAGEAPVVSRVPLSPGRLLAAFDRVWDTLARLYYNAEPAAGRWLELRDAHRPHAASARDERALERVIDAMVADQPLVRQPARSRRAVVVSGHRLASEAGARMLEHGGNVVDAAIATSFVLGVVEPDASGIGGDGMALVFLKGMREPVVVDFKDQTPIHATLDNPAIFRGGRLVDSGPAAANIPGHVAGMDLMFRRFGSGRVPWTDLIAPAIRHAEEGFVLDAALPTTIAEGQALFARHEGARRIFLPDGRVPRPGDRFVNREYAATLRAIASRGAAEFYQGDIARRIASDMTASGGIIQYEDLAQYRAIERAPVSGRFRGHLVFSTPPPVASGTSLVEVLQVLDRHVAAPGVSPTRDANYLHVQIESWKVAHQLTRVADPALWPVEVAPHLEPAHAAELYRQIDLQKASKTRRPPADRDAGSGGQPPPGSGMGRGTTAFAVADGEGNVVVVTQTLSTWGGNFYVSPGLGFLYNNHLRLGRTRRGAFGQLLPLTRSSSTSAPTLIVREADGVRVPRLAVGAAGNAWILPSVFHVVSRVIDGGASAQAAVEAPRFLVGRDPADAAGETARVQIEDRYPADVITELEKRGHVFHKIGRKGELRYGYASAITFDAESGTLEAGADPRRSHHAVGLQ